MKQKVSKDIKAPAGCSAFRTINLPHHINADAWAQVELTTRELRRQQAERGAK